MGQKEEVETIKERNISLKLSDADVERISKKAGGVGLTVSQLLENFIGDLVGGTYTNGSDERMYAVQWFDRCDFTYSPEKTFIKYLIEYEELEHTLDLWDEIKTAKDELEYAESHKDEFTSDAINDWETDLECWQEEINDTFSDYQGWAKGKEVSTLEDEMKKVIEWQNEYKKILN